VIVDADDDDSTGFDEAIYGPIEDQGLARQLVDRLLTQFFRQAGLDERYRADAFAQCSLEQGSAHGRIVALRLRLPLGTGNPEVGWDGRPADAFDIVEQMAATAARTILIERSAGFPTGWGDSETERCPGQQ